MGEYRGRNDFKQLDKNILEYLLCLIRNSIIIWMASKNLTKYFFILMPAPLCHLFVPIFCGCAGNTFFLMPFGTNLRFIWSKSSIIFKQIDAGTASFKGAIWDKFRGQHKHSRYQSIKKRHIQCPIITFLGKHYFN